MGFELHIGPYRGRDPQLLRKAFGVVANGMELYEASKIPFATIADYLAAPETYDPERAGAGRSATSSVTPTSRPSLLFADNVRSSCLGPDDAPVVTARARVVRVPAGPGRGRGRGDRPRDAGGPAHRRGGPPAARAGREHGADRRVPAVDRGVRDRGAGDRRIAELAANGRLERDARTALVRSSSAADAGSGCSATRSTGRWPNSRAPTSGRDR